MALWAGGVTVTLTVALALLVVSASLVAVTVYVPAVLGAVYIPDVLIVPPLVDQVTAGFVVLLTVAVNCCVPPAITFALLGLMVTVTAGGELIVTEAVALIEGLA